jgi:hypothetical protein
MTIPGFSAEGSLYEGHRHYRTAHLSSAVAASEGVLPQLAIGFCQANCDQQHPDHGSLDYNVCLLGCLGEGDGGGGGGTSGGLTPAQCYQAVRGCRRACRYLPKDQQTDCFELCLDIC